MGDVGPNQVLIEEQCDEFFSQTYQTPRLIKYGSISRDMVANLRTAATGK